MITQKHTRRAARRASHEKKEKSLAAVERRLKEIWEIQRDQNRGLKKLDEPIFAGYKRYYVVREDIARGHWGADAKFILPFIQNIVYCRRKDFTAKSWKSKKWEPIPHELAGIRDWVWKKEKYDEIWPTKIKSLFRLTIVQHQFGSYVEYQTTRPWWFEEKQSRYYFTHYRDADGVLASEEKKLKDKLDEAHYWEKTYGKGGYRDPNPFTAQDPFDWRHWDDYLENLVSQ